MNTTLSPLAQGYGVCRRDGVILIPEASGAIPSYSTQVKNAEGSALYGHFVPVPKTYLTRRGDIILFTENACDIVYLEQMYSRKIRELYEQQIKTVDDLNKSILFYGSKTPGEYSLNFIRGKFYSDRDIAVQPGHLPTHYLNSLTRHVKLSSVLRPRAPPGTGVSSTPFILDAAVKNIKLPIPGEEMVETTDEEEEDYERTAHAKHRAPSPVDMNKLPPIQVSQKFDPRPKPSGVSPRLNKVGLNSNVLGLHGTNALPIKKQGSEIPALPKVLTGPSAKAKSRGEWKKLGNLINSINVLKRISQGKEKDKESLTIVEDIKPIYKSAMAMDIHFLKENRRHISHGDPEGAVSELSLDDILLGLKDKHGKKPYLPPLQVQWSPEQEKREKKEEEEARRGTLSRSGSGDARSASRKSPRSIAVSSARRVSPYAGASVQKGAAVDGKMISPFDERRVTSGGGSQDSGTGSRSVSVRSGELIVPQSDQPTQPQSFYQATWSPDVAEAELEGLSTDQMDEEYQDHVAQARRLLARQQQLEEEEIRRQEEADGEGRNSIPALYVDDTEQVYVGELYGDVQTDRNLNQDLPFDYMGFVRNLSKSRNAQVSDGGGLTLQSQSLGGGALSQPLQPGLYVMRPSNQPTSPRSKQAGSSEQLGIGLGVDKHGRPFAGEVTREHGRPPRSARQRSTNNPGVMLKDGESLAPGAAGLTVPGSKEDYERAAKEGYVYRAQAPGTGPVTPDQRMPQRILHQKDPNPSYVLKRDTDHSFLNIPGRQQGRRQPSSKQKESGYVLKAGIPMTGVPQGHDQQRRIPRQSKRRNLAPTQNAYPSSSLDETTKDIISALESGKDTSKFGTGHVDTAKAIRDELKARDPNFSLDSVIAAAPTASEDPNQDLQKAEKYLEELSRMRSEVEMDDTAEYDQYYSDTDDPLAPQYLYRSEDPPANGSGTQQFSPTSANGAPLPQQLIHPAANGSETQQFYPAANGSEAQQFYPTSANGAPLPQQLIHPAANGSGAQQFYPAANGSETQQFYPAANGSGTQQSYHAANGPETQQFYPAANGSGTQQFYPAANGSVAQQFYPTSANGVPLPQQLIHPDANGSGTQQYYPAANGSGTQQYYPAANGSGAQQFYDSVQADPGELQQYPGIVISGEGDDKEWSSLNGEEASPLSSGGGPAKQYNTSILPQTMDFLGGTPDSKIERMQMGPTVPPQSGALTPRFDSSGPRSRPRTPRKSGSRRGSRRGSVPGAGEGDHQEYHNQVSSPGQPDTQPKIRVQMMGSEEAPRLPTMGDERYVINPSIPYPAGPQQENVHYPTFEIEGGYEPSMLGGTSGWLPKRMMASHMVFRSQVGTPARARSARNVDPTRPKSAHPGGMFGVNPNNLTTALDNLQRQVPDILVVSDSTGPGSTALDRSRTSSSIDSGMLEEEEHLEQIRLDDTAENLEKIVRLRSEMADNFQHNINSTADLDMFSDITDSEVTTPLRETEPGYDVAVVPGLLDIPEESSDHTKGSKRKCGPLDGSHAGVYLTQLYRDGAWTNEDVPVYVTPDGKVFISSVIVNQPVCSSDRIKFAQQDDADDVHNKPEEGSLTFSDGKLTGWVKFPGQKAVKMRGKRWDPRQTGHYVVEKKAVPEIREEGKELDKEEWQLVPVDLSIMLGGKVTMNDEPVFNPLFEENNIKLRLNDDELHDDLKYIVASFDPTCTFFKGRLTSDCDVEIDVVPHNKLDTLHHEVEIRARKWNPALVGHYYCLKKTEAGVWEPFDLPLEILPDGTMALKEVNLGVPQYNGNEVNMCISRDSLPVSIALTFLEDKYIGYITAPNGVTEEIRGIRWDSTMVGKYSTQEKQGDSWINKNETFNIAPDGSVEYDGRSLTQGFIVDNKVFVVSEGGVESFFDNTGPVSDANLSGQSFLMQRDSPVRPIPAAKASSVTSQKDQLADSLRTIQEAEIVFSSNRFYGHVMCDEEEEFVEIRGYKWDEAIVGEYFTEVLKSDGVWGGGPTITINPDGTVLVNNVPMSDTLLKDNIVSINNIKVPHTKQIEQCLVAVQDKLLSGWIQATADSPKVQIRGSLWKEGPGAHGSYICAEKVGDKWTSSNNAVIVTPSNKVRISDLNIEGEMDGLSALLVPAQGAASTTSIDTPTVAKLRFEGDTFAGTITDKGHDTEIAGFKFDTTPGVYLLESRPLNTDQDWTGLNRQLVVSENGRISVSGAAVTDMRVENEVLHFDTDALIKHLAIQFKDKSVVGQGVQQDEDGTSSEVEVRGRTWCHKIAGTYETEIFTDSGWKTAKKLEITPQGEVLYGSEHAENVRLDTDTMSFGAVAGQLQDATLSFDRDGFTGNVVTPKDNKNRVFRGKRIGTRPISAHSGTELSLGNEEEDNFEDLNGQIGSTLKIKMSSGVSSPVDVPAEGLRGPGVTSDYGSASDVITHQLSGSRTEALSSLEEDVSTRSKSPAGGRGKDQRRDSGTADSGEGEEVTIRERSSAKDPSRGGRGAAGEDQVDLGDISLDLHDSSDPGVSFESWPPDKDAEGKVIELGDGSKDEDEDEDSERVTLDLLPQGLSSLGKTETKDFTKDEDLLNGSPKLPGIGTTSDTPKFPPVSTGSPISSKTPGSGPMIPDKTTRTPLPVIPPKTLDTPALTRPVKLPGIDMKTKGGAAEITEDAGLLKNYIEPKEKKKGKKGRRVKKGKAAKSEKKEQDKKKEVVEEEEEEEEVAILSSSSPLDLDERARQGIEQAQARRTPTARTPVSLSRIDRDSSRDTSPVSSASGYLTPNEYTNGQPQPAQREFQGALMAAKKIRETSDQQLDGKIPSDIREHPVAEEVAEKFGMEMKVRDEGSSKLSVKERRELARQKKKEDAERKRRERDEEKRRQKEEEEKKLAEEEAMRQRRAEREAELAAERQRELERRKVEEAKRRQAKLEEREKKKREEDRMLDAKRRLEEELKRRREAEAARLAENERQKQLALEREREEQEKRMVEAEAIRAQMEVEMAREMVEYERKVREEQERRRIEDALKAEAERRLLDEEERKRIIALARHLWNKGVRIEGENLTQELEISSIFYSYFNYLQSEEPFNPDVDIAYKEKILKLESLQKTKELDKV